MKQLAKQIKDSNGDYSYLEGSPLLSPKVIMGNCIDDLNNMAETQAEIKVTTKFFSPSIMFLTFFQSIIRQLFVDFYFIVSSQKSEI